MKTILIKNVKPEFVNILIDFIKENIQQSGGFADCTAMADVTVRKVDIANIQVKEAEEVYFLFGETVCNKYHEEDFSEVIAAVESGTEFAVHKYIIGEHPENIMEASAGWMDYACILKEEYEQLLKIKEDGE